jgi:hypothetical protein
MKNKPKTQKKDISKYERLRLKYVEYMRKNMPNMNRKTLIFKDK